MRIKLTVFDLYEEDTPYGHIRVNRGFVDGEKAIILMVDRGAQSAQYTATERKDELVFDYMQRYSYAFAVNPQIRQTFMIGGGGFTYPQYYVKKYAGAKIDVAEISKETIEIANDYFGMKSLDVKDANRIRVICQDGIEWLRRHPKKYDFIINDAFIGMEEKGRSERSTKIICEHLNPGGIYVVNVLSSISGKNAENAQVMKERLKKYFKNIACMIMEEDIDPDEMQNMLIFASNRELL